MEITDNIWCGMIGKGQGVLSFVESSDSKKARMLLFSGKQKLLDYLSGENLPGVKAKKIAFLDAVKVAKREGLDIMIDRPVGGGFCVVIRTANYQDVNLN